MLGSQLEHRDLQRRGLLCRAPGTSGESDLSPSFLPSGRCTGESAQSHHTHTHTHTHAAQGPIPTGPHPQACSKRVSRVLEPISFRPQVRSGPSSPGTAAAQTESGLSTQGAAPPVTPGGCSWLEGRVFFCDSADRGWEASRLTGRHTDARRSCFPKRTALAVCPP